MKCQLYVVVCLYCSTTFCASLNCERNSDENCLEDCQWNETFNKCVDCDAGFYGKNCSSRCRYPNYGQDCQQDCSHCDQELCDSKFGCPKNDGTTPKDSKASKEISFGSVQLVYVIIGLMTSGFLVTFITSACLFRRKKLWVRNIRSSSFVDRLSYH